MAKNMGKRTILTFSAGKSDTFVSQRHTLSGCGSFWRASPLSRLALLVALQGPHTAVPKEALKSSSPNRQAGMCLLWDNIPSREDVHLTPGLQTEARVKQQHVLLFQVKYSLSSCSSKQSIFLWTTEAYTASAAGKRSVLREAVIRGQTKQDKSVVVLRACFTDCHTPWSLESLLIPKGSGL